MLHRLLGTLCVLCAARLNRPLRDIQLCSFCTAALPWDTEPERDCYSDFSADIMHSPIVRTVTALRYEQVARDWVMAAKKQSGLTEAKLLGGLLAEAVAAAYCGGNQLPAYLIPVPLSLTRLLRRGHNQAILIAEPVARASGIPLLRNSVRRTRHTAIQPGLDASARAANVRGAFRSRRQWQGQSLAIIDDVMTSGATACTLAACLRDAGAGDIHLWCATRAGTPAAHN